MAQVIYVAAELSLADHLAGGPRTIEDLAAATGTHPSALSRLVRALASIGAVAEAANGTIELTTIGASLRSDVPGSIRASVRFRGGEWSWRSLGDLLYSVRTGEPAFNHVFGMTNFDYWERHPEAGEIHDAFFTGMARLTTPPLVGAYDFVQFGTLVDVGGSQGPLLAAILRANTKLRGILFDLPHVVAGAARVLTEAGVEDRCAIVGGDFFEAVPKGGDAYLMKYILHDWDDARAISILKRCREAMSPGNVLLVIENVLPERLDVGAKAQQAARLDLQMLVMTPGGRERTAGQFRSLFSEAGFALQRVVPTDSPFSIVEGVAI
jgi:predicted O-methyltransferase YrrM